MKELDLNTAEILSTVGATPLNDKWGAHRMTYEQAREYARIVRGQGRFPGQFPGVPGQTWIVAYHPGLNFPPLVLEAEYNLLQEPVAPGEVRTFWDIGKVYKWIDAQKLAHQSATIRALTLEDAVLHLRVALAFFNKFFPERKGTQEIKDILNRLGG